MIEPARTHPQPLSYDRRRELLEQQVMRSVANGWRVEVQNPTSAVLVSGKSVNHVLHLLLTLVTFGLWAIVWIIAAFAGGEKRSTVAVDEYGQIAWSAPKRAAV